MEQNIKIAKELVRIAKMLVADADNKWQVWSIDCLGNEQDGWEFNDRSRSFQIEASSDNEDDIAKAFAENVGTDKSNFSFEWDGEEDCTVTDAKTGEMLYQINKEF